MDKIVLSLTLAQVNIVLAALSKQPLESVMDTFLEIRKQGDSQINASAGADIKAAE